MNNITGSPVEGDDFFGRENEIKFAWKHIQAGNSLIFPAPRRVGKTSFAKKLLETAKTEGWKTLEINLEENQNEKVFVTNLLEKMENTAGWFDKTIKNAGDTLSKIMESIKIKLNYEGVETSIGWQREKNDVYSSLEKLFNHERNTLIFIDELTILLNNFIENDPQNGKKDVEFLLNWLRSLRHISGTKIRWIFCSSIGIENFTNRHGVSYTFNDVAELKLEPFSREEAGKLLKKISDETLPLEVFDAILDKIQWYVPYFIQILYFHYTQKIEIERLPHSIDTLEQAYNSLINSRAFNTWDERLKEYGETEMSARKILNHLSKIKEGTKKEILISLLHRLENDIDETELKTSRVLNILQNDGYLVREQENYLFRSPLLRDFWYNRFA